MLQLVPPPPPLPHPREFISLRLLAWLCFGRYERAASAQRVCLGAVLSDGVTAPTFI